MSITEKLAGIRARDADTRLVRNAGSTYAATFDQAWDAVIDRRYLLTLVDDLAAALREIADAGNWAWTATDGQHRRTPRHMCNEWTPATPASDIARAALAKLGDDNDENA